MQEVVGRGGQRLALDETVPGASIGGTLATNTSGPRRVATGTARDLLIGITVVRADGVVAKAGGRVVKNVAGYDLGKLMIGSFGTLAVVTEAVFRLHPLPDTRRWVSVPVADPARPTTRSSRCCTPRPCPPRSRSSGPPTAGEPCTCCSRVARTASPAVPPPSASSSARPSTESADPPAGGATYPWDMTADRATTAPPRSS